MNLGRITLAVVALGLAQGAAAAELDFDLSNSSARIAYRFDVTDTGLSADVGLLHHEDDGDVLHIGILLVGDAGQGEEPLTAGLGLRALNVDANVVDGTALAIGGFANYVFPDYNRFAIGGEVYIAPSVTSFGDLDSYLELSVRGEYRLTKTAAVYVGVRDVQGDFVAPIGSQTIDDGIFVGISLDF